MKLSKHFPPLTKEEEDNYLCDKAFAHLNGYTEWEKSQPSYTLFQALEIFPEAKPIVKRELKEELAKLCKEIEGLEQDLKDESYVIQQTERSYHEAMRRIAMITERFERYKIELEDKLKRIRFNLARIDGKVPKGEIGAEEIMRAKEVPLGELLPFDRADFTKCIFHTEKHSSMKWYKKDNRFNCFGCGKSGDSVDVVMRQSGISFIEAVKLLCQK